MKVRDMIDRNRLAWMNSDDAPTREIIYTRSDDDFEYPPLNSFVGGGQFNKDEKDKLEDHQSFSGLELPIKPKVNDTVLYDGVTYKVQRYVKLGTLYSVFGRVSRHSGRPNKR